MPKLVRDKIPEIIRKNDKREPKTRILDDEEYTQRLREKLVEEAKEILNAGNDVETANEIADLYEVIDALIKHLGIDKKRVKRSQDLKRNERGGFKKRILLDE